MSKKNIFLDRSARHPILKLNRVEKKNAMNLAMWQGMIDILKDIEKDDSVKVLIVSGAGKSFASGADISEMERVFDNPDVAYEIAKTTYNAQRALNNFPKPTIAMIRGACVGGGCGIALCCDFRLADTSSILGVTPGNLGLVYSVADTKLLIDTVGFSVAKDILFTGRLLKADEAKSIGLVDRLLSEEELEEAVYSYADQICGTSGFSLQANKKIIKMIQNGLYDDNSETRKMFIDAFSGKDFKEGFQAFSERRKPKFSKD